MKLLLSAVPFVALFTRANPTGPLNNLSYESPYSNIRHLSITRSLGHVAKRQTGSPSRRGAFQHGVASGDPLPNAVIIWTKVSPADRNLAVRVSYSVSSDPELNNVVAEGTVDTSSDIDHTVKLDITSLDPDSVYFYAFSAFDQKSVVGQTRTLPLPDALISNTTMAFVSCATLWHGYFFAYREIARRPDIHFVVHLGDYLYEYEKDDYPSPGDADLPDNRDPQPSNTCVTLSDYRTRYAQYRQDQDLQELHRIKPFIPGGDDHDFAESAWWSGAPDHDSEDDGPWSERRFSAARAWFEYLPVRQAFAIPVSEGPDNRVYQIYRKFKIGNLIELFMLDTRIIGRDQQGSGNGNGIRSLLGESQRRWLYDSLDNSTASYRVIGNQVMFAPKPSSFGPFEPSLIADDWNGYPEEQQMLADHIIQGNMTNIVMFTGDLHTSVASNVLKPKAENDTPENRMFVEFVGPSVTSSTPAKDSDRFAQVIAPFFFDFNPGLQGLDLVNHGFMQASFNQEQLAVDYVYVESVRDARGDTARTNATFVVKVNEPSILGTPMSSVQ